MANRVYGSKKGTRKEILKFSDYVAASVTIDAADVAAGDNGRKILPAGTIIGGKTNPALLNEGEVVVDKNTAGDAAGAEGVLLYDVDVTDGDREGAMVIYGYINVDKIPAEPVAEVDLPKITFLK